MDMKLKRNGLLGLLAGVLLLTGCVASTYRLTPEEQGVALRKYPQAPGLNLVAGETGWNTAKVAARVVLAPLTLCISEGILCNQRSRPYRLYHDELRDQAIAAGGEKHVDFSVVCRIGQNYAYFDKEFSRRLTAIDREFPDTRTEYWEGVFALGCDAIDAMLEKYGFSKEARDEVKWSDGEDAHKTRVMMDDHLTQTIRRMEEARKAIDQARREAELERELRDERWYDYRYHHHHHHHHHDHHDMKHEPGHHKRH